MMVPYTYSKLTGTKVIMEMKSLNTMGRHHVVSIAILKADSGKRCVYDGKIMNILGLDSDNQIRLVGYGPFVWGGRNS